MSKQRPPLTKQQKIGFRVAAGLLPILALIIAIGAINEKNAPTPPAATTTGGPAEQKPVEAAAEPKPASAAPEAALTVENKDFAALLAAVNDHDLFKEFAAKYQGRTVKFDGTIAAMNHHGDYKTRYDILVFAGDSIESGVTGPNFQFNDVNITFDLHLTGSNIPDTIGVGQKLRITAEVKGYAGNQDLFLLDPVSTEVR